MNEKINENKYLFVGLGVVVLGVMWAKKANAAPPSPPPPTPKSDRNKPNGVHYAVFNRNPGNIRNSRTAKKYAGEITPENNIYKQFDTWQNGFAAMIAHLRRYINGELFGNKKDTISKILYTYAPPSENDTEKYVRFVSNRTGIGKNTTLDHNNKEVMYKLTEAFALQESNVAHKELNQAIFNTAWETAKKQS